MPEDILAIDSNKVGLDELQDLVTQITQCVGGKATVEAVYVVQSDSRNLLRALEAIFFAQLPAVEPKLSKKTRKAAPAAVKERKPIRSWRVSKPNGEDITMLSAVEKDEALRLGMFDAGTKLSHPRAGTFVVSGDRGSEQKAVSV